MHNCDNCQVPFDPDKEGLVTRERGRLASGICAACIKDVTLLKIVLRRKDVGGFAYEQYAPLEVRKKAG
jgi:hypothetical protein